MEHARLILIHVVDAPGARLLGSQEWDQEGNATRQMSTDTTIAGNGGDIG